MTLPSDALDTPYPKAQIPDSVNLLLGLSDYISPSYYLRKGIEVVIGYDPATWLSEEFAGDWQAVAASASACEQLGEYMDMLGAEVFAARARLDTHWDGNAGHNAGLYFDALAADIAALKAPLVDIGDAFNTTATGIKATGESITSLLGLLLDYLIELGIAALATSAVSWTGVGLLIGGSGTAYLAYKATSTWMKVVEAHGNASTIAKGVTGLTAGSLALLHVDEKLELPAAYDHPSVDR